MWGFVVISLILNPKKRKIKYPSFHFRKSALKFTTRRVFILRPKHSFREILLLIAMDQASYELEPAWFWYTKNYFSVLTRKKFNKNWRFSCFLKPLAWIDCVKQNSDVRQHNLALTHYELSICEDSWLFGWYSILKERKIDISGFHFQKSGSKFKTGSVSIIRLKIIKIIVRSKLSPRLLTVEHIKFFAW